MAARDRYPALAMGTRWHIGRLGSDPPHQLAIDLHKLDEVRSNAGQVHNADRDGCRFFWTDLADGVTDAFIRKGPNAAQARCCTDNLSRSPRSNRSPIIDEAFLMLELIKDLWSFMRIRKKFWLAPIIIVMLLLGGLIVLSQGSAVAPFIYTLF